MIFQEAEGRGRMCGQAYNTLLLQKRPPSGAVGLWSLNQVTSLSHGSKPSEKEAHFAKSDFGLLNSNSQPIPSVGKLYPNEFPKHLFQVMQFVT